MSMFPDIPYAIVTTEYHYTDMFPVIFFVSYSDAESSKYGTGCQNLSPGDLGGYQVFLPYASPCIYVCYW